MRRSPVWVVSVALVALALGGCPRPPPPPPRPPPPPPIVVPQGCMENLSGDWTHAENPSFHYRAEDDGGTLTLTVRRVFADAGFRPRRFGGPSERDAGATAGAGDAGLRVASADAGADAGADGGADGNPRNDAGFAPPSPPRVELSRTPQGFVGRTTAEVLHPSGQTCTTAFSTQLVECGDGGLVLRTEGAVAVGDTCSTPPSPHPASLIRHTLIRAAAPGADTRGLEVPGPDAG